MHLPPLPTPRRAGELAAWRFPLLAHPVPAGFPSPANDFVEQHLSLDEHVIEHPEATFFVRVAGHSMTGFGIHHGDLLVVDRAMTPTSRSIVVAVVDGQFTVKQLNFLPDGVLLRGQGNDTSAQQDFFVTAEQELTVWGVVRWTIHRV
jgi:DNA polymerase V